MKIHQRSRGPGIPMEQWVMAAKEELYAKVTPRRQRQTRPSTIKHGSTLDVLLSMGFPKTRAWVHSNTHAHTQTHTADTVITRLNVQQHPPYLLSSQFDASLSDSTCFSTDISGSTEASLQHVVNICRSLWVHLKWPLLNSSFCSWIHSHTACSTAGLCNKDECHFFSISCNSYKYYIFLVSVNYTEKKLYGGNLYFLERNMSLDVWSATGSIFGSEEVFISNNLMIKITLYYKYKYVQTAKCTLEYLYVQAEWPLFCFVCMSALLLLLMHKHVTSSFMLQAASQSFFYLLKKSCVCTCYMYCISMHHILYGTSIKCK